MIPSLDRVGWGKGAQDPEPPLAAGGPEVLRGQLLLLELLVEALQTWTVGRYLDSTFALPDARHPEAYASYVRLLTQLHALFRTVLPRLRRAVRCENHPQGAWLEEPRGGRLDPLASLRQPDAWPSPQRWRVVRAARVTATPPNRVAASVLRAAEARLVQSRRALADAGLGPARHLDFAGLGVRRLRRFLVQSPLGELPAEPLTPDLVRAAQRRRSSWAKLRPLWRWWQELQQVDLRALRQAGTAEARPLSQHHVYESCAALALVLALSERLGPPTSTDDGLVYGQGGREVRLTLGASPDRRGRPSTALLRILGGDAPRTLVIEARNAQGDAAEDTRRMLAYFAHKGGVEGCLVTPAPLPEVEGVRHLVWPLGAGASRGSATTAWGPLLDQFVGPSHPLGVVP